MKYYYKERNWLYIYFDEDKERIGNQIKYFRFFQFNKYTGEYYTLNDPSKEIVLKSFLEDNEFTEGKQIKEEIVLPNYYEKFTINEVKDAIKEIPLKMTPRDYQIEGLHYMINHKNTINGFAVGLGKTGCSILFAELLNLFPCLIICPSTVKPGWKKEWNKWIDERSVSIIDASNKENDWTSDVIIINYDILQERRKSKTDARSKNFRYEELKNIDFKLLIIDEVHLCKNYQSIRSKNVAKLARKIDEVISLTGTLAVNRPQEIMSILMMTGHFFKMFKKDGIEMFKWRYCNAKQTPFGMDLKGSNNIEELHTILKHYCYMRKEKRDVLRELPPIIEQMISCKLSNEKEYYKAENNLIEYLEEIDFEKAENAKRAEHLVKLNVLRQLCIKGKLKDISFFIKEWLESNEDEKLLVFGVFKEPLKELSKQLGSLCLTGEDNYKEKQRIIEDFKTKENERLLCANLQTIGTGVDGLQDVCSNIIYIELPVNPKDLEQSTGRIDRQGQKMNMNVWYMINEDSIDIDMFGLLFDKKDVTDSVNKGYREDYDISFEVMENFLKRKK